MIEVKPDRRPVATAGRAARKNIHADLSRFVSDIPVESKSRDEALPAFKGMEQTPLINRALLSDSLDIVASKALNGYEKSHFIAWTNPEPQVTS